MLRQIPHDKYKMVMFTKMTDIVVSAGKSSQIKELLTRPTAIEACLKKLIRGQCKFMALLSTNINVLSAFRCSLPAGNKLTSHWGGKQKHANVPMGRKAESGAERPLRKAESRAVDLPGPAD